MKEHDYPGTLIAVEGADGAGTTTQSKKLADEMGAEWTAEPTSGPVGEKIQEMIRSDDYSAEAIALNFAADRMLHLEQEVIPLLKQGKTVVTDRYYHSSLTYQPALGADFEWVRELNKDALKPDLTIVVDVEPEEALSRIEGREFGKINSEIEDENSQTSLRSASEGTDVIFENLSFEQEVIQRYRDLEARLDEDIEAVDGSDSIEQVFDQISSAVQDRNLF